MKKLLLILSIIFVCMSCDTNRYVAKHEAQWWIHNSTSQTIVVPASRSNTIDTEIKVGETGLVSITVTADNIGKPTFKMYLSLRTTITITSMDGEVLRVWNAAEKDDAGKQYFNEKYWDFSEDPYTVYLKRGGVLRRWTFELTDSDLIQAGA